MIYQKLPIYISLLLFTAFTASAQTTVTITAYGSTVSDATTWTNCTVNITGSETITYSERIIISGSVTLNLGEGATLIASQGIAVNQGNSLTIDGKGTLEANCKKYENRNAAIGGSEDSPNAGTITISDGTIKATSFNVVGSYAAAIGGGAAGNGGSITINGGTVTTLVSCGGAASIGGGYGGSGGHITITGGTITAKSADNNREGAGIGGGKNGDGGNITISGGNITALGSSLAAGIGGGSYDGGNITISGGNITAVGGSWAAGIGGGGYGDGGNISITGGVINATGGRESAGIGGVSGKNGGTITISGGQITAKGGTNAYGIGAGKDGTEGTITLSWTNNTDFIDASYAGTITFADGKRFYYDGTEDYATSEGLYKQAKKIVPAVVNNSLLSNGEIRMQRSFVTTEGTSVVVTYEVYDYQNNKLTLGTDYMAVIKNSSGQTVTTFNHLGDYTLTVTGKGSYSGSNSYTFSLVEWDMALTQDGGEHYINLPKNGTKTVNLNVGQSIKVYDSEGKSGKLVVSDGRLLIRVPEGYALQVSGKTDAMYYNKVQRKNINSLSAYETEDFTDEIISLFSNSDNVSFSSGGNSMLIRLNCPEIYEYENYNEYGLELTVSVVPAVPHTITKGTLINGNITIDKTSAYTNETVTVTVSPASGCLLTGIKITDTDNGSALSTVGTDQWYSGENTVTFKMPFNNITVTPVFTNDLTANSLPTLNMPLSGERTFLIPDGVKSFNISGSPLGIRIINANASTSTSAILQVPDGYCLQATGKVDWYNREQDEGELSIYDGANKSAALLTNIQGNNNDIVSIGTLTSSSNCMTIYLYEYLLYDAKFTGTIAILKPLAHTDIAIAAIAAQTWTGSKITPAVVVTDGETTLTLGTDYTVEYSNNIYAGTAKATITGKGNYSGTVKKSFEIVPKVTTLGALTLTEYGNRTTAEIDGKYTGADAFSIDQDIAVSSVSFSRTFTANQYSTIILPFDVPNAANCGLFYSFDGVKHEGDAWIADVTKVTEVKANTPYLFKPSTATPDLTKDVKKLVATTSIIPENDKWDFVGMYQYKEWAEDADKDYGFAGEEDGDIQIGEFVKVGAGASINPFRCYLTYKGTNNDLSKSAVELPDRIIVRVTDHDATDDDSNTEIITPVSEITAEDGIKVWSYNHTAYISAQPGMEYRIVDMGGRTIRHGVTTSNREEVSLNGINGIVIVKIGNQTFKIKY